jgi:hypothetical protein
LIAVNAPIFLFEVCAAINCGSSWGNLGRRPESRGADGPEGSSGSDGWWAERTLPALGFGLGFGGSRLGGFHGHRI